MNGCGQNDTSEPQTIADSAGSTLSVTRQCGEAGVAQFRNVTYARTAEQLELGLMNRREPMAADEAMVFVFDPPRPVNFWMKNTFIPLDVAYFDAQGRLVEAYFMPVERDPEHPRATYPSGGIVKYAVEAAPGTFVRSGPAAAVARDLQLCGAPF